MAKTYKTETPIIRNAGRDVLFSVCIPTYNGGKFLRQAIESVLSQGVESIEIIISDNASTDDTERIMREINSPCIRYYRNEKNIGMCANFRKSLELAQGEFVTFICADDLLYTGALSELSCLLQANPTMAFAFSQVEFIGERRGVTHHRLPPIMREREFVKHSLSKARNLVHLCTGTFRRSLANASDIDNLLFFDWVFWLRLGLRGRVGFIDRTLGAHRYHGANNTKSDAASFSDEYKNLALALERFDSTLPGESLSLKRQVAQARTRLFLRYTILLLQRHGHTMKWVDEIRTLIRVTQIPIWAQCAAFFTPFYLYGLQNAATLKRWLRGKHCAS